MATPWLLGRMHASADSSRWMDSWIWLGWVAVFAYCLPSDVLGWEVTWLLLLQNSTSSCWWGQTKWHQSAQPAGGCPSSWLRSTVCSSGIDSPYSWFDWRRAGERERDQKCLINLLERLSPNSYFHPFGRGCWSPRCGSSALDSVFERRWRLRSSRASWSHLAPISRQCTGLCPYLWSSRHSGKTSGHGSGFELQTYSWYVIRLSSSLCRTILKLNNTKLENLFLGAHIFKSIDFEITSPIAVIKNQKQKFIQSFGGSSRRFRELKCCTQVVLCPLASTYGTLKKRYVFYLLHILIWYFVQFWKIWKIAL